MQKWGLCTDLVEALVSLIEKKVLNRDRRYSISDLPILCDNIKISIQNHTDDGRILVDGKPYQLCAVKALKFPKKEQRLTLVDTLDLCHQVFSLW
jgi:hypothetical protein